MAELRTGPALLRWFVALAGLAAVLGALVSLSIPMTLHVVDRTGVPIACGTGLNSGGETARHEDSLNHQQHQLVGAQFVVTDYAGECTARVVDRRWLAAGVAGFGAALALGAYLAPYVVMDRPGRRRYVRADASADALNSYAAW
jgi:membrane protein implicated in regulation of membrane protease activity